jgi:hypothetical protein
MCRADTLVRFPTFVKGTKTPEDQPQGQRRRTGVSALHDRIMPTRRLIDLQYLLASRHPHLKTARCGAPIDQRGLGKQSYTGEQIREARIGAQRVQLGFYVEVAQPKRPLFKGSLQPRERFVIFLQAHVNHRYVVR